MVAILNKERYYGIFVIIFFEMFRGSRKEMADQIKEEFLPRPDKYHDMINNKQVPTTH